MNLGSWEMTNNFSIIIIADGLALSCLLIPQTNKNNKLTRAGIALTPNAPPNHEFGLETSE